MTHEAFLRAAAAGVVAGSALACASAKTPSPREPAPSTVTIPAQGSDREAADPGAPPAREEPSGQLDPNCCAGKNECKGLGRCAVEGDHGCAGKNECKGKGGCHTNCPPPTEQPCERGMNECKGQGNCKTASHDCKGMNDCKGQGGCRGFCPR
jgi:hypothetical protein